MSYGAIFGEGLPHEQHFLHNRMLGSSSQTFWCVGHPPRCWGKGPLPPWVWISCLLSFPQLLMVWELDASVVPVLDPIWKQPIEAAIERLTNAYAHNP